MTNHLAKITEISKWAKQALKTIPASATGEAKAARDIAQGIIDVIDFGTTAICHDCGEVVMDFVTDRFDDERRCHGCSKAHVAERVKGWRQEMAEQSFYRNRG